MTGRPTVAELSTQVDSLSATVESLTRTQVRQVEAQYVVDQSPVVAPWGAYAKAYAGAIVAALVAGLGTLTGGALDDGLSASEAVAAAVAFLGALALTGAAVERTPNGSTGA